MSEAKMKLIYFGVETTILCSPEENIKDILKRYSIKIKKDINNLVFYYNANLVDKEKKYKDIINNIDKERKEMNIIVYDYNNTIIEERIIKSKDIICKECKKNIKIKIDNYRYNIYGCKHERNNIKIKEFENSQEINESKIICEICNENNKGNAYNNEFYRCIICNKNICPLCKIKHNHNIIEYDKINYICNKHNLNYIRYCKECNKNICMKCEKEHNNHERIYYGDILPNEDNGIKELKEYINKLRKEINDIIYKLNNILINMEIYYNMSNNIINNNIINNNNINYEILININEYIKYNNIIIKDIKNIINNNDIKEKINNIINIYNKMNVDNYIIGEIEIKEEDINKEIRIINTFEEVKRQNKWEDDEDD